MKTTAKENLYQLKDLLVNINNEKYTGNNRV